MFDCTIISAPRELWDLIIGSTFVLLLRSESVDQGEQIGKVSSVLIILFTASKVRYRTKVKGNLLVKWTSAHTQRLFGCYGR